jgi:hypothetical protein
MQMSKFMLVLVLLAAGAQAWWDKGHMLTSQIAWNRLTELGHTQARDNFNQLV